MASKPRMAKDPETGEVFYEQPDGSWAPQALAEAAPAAAPAPAPAVAPASGDTPLDTFGRFSAQGASFGFSDEMEALGLMAGKPERVRAAGRGIDAPAMSEEPSEFVQTQAELDASAAENPNAALAGEIFGGVMTAPAVGAGGAKLLGTAAKAAPRAAAAVSRVVAPAKRAVDALEVAGKPMGMLNVAAPAIRGAAANVLPGAAMGALSGAGHAREGERLAGAADGAQVGGIIGMLGGANLGALGGMAKVRGEAAWKSRGQGSDPENKLIGMASEAGAEPTMGAATVKPSAAMDAAQSRAPVGHSAADVLYDDATDVVLNATMDSVGKAPGLDDVVAAALPDTVRRVASAPSLDDIAVVAHRQLAQETQRTVAATRQILNKAIADYPNTQVPVDRLVDDLNALVAREVSDVTKETVEGATAKAQGIVGMPEGVQPVLYGAGSDNPLSSAPKFREIFQRLLRTVDDDEASRLQMGSAGEQSLAQEIAGEAEAAAPALRRKASLTVSEAIQFRRDFDEAAKQATKLMKDSDASSFGRLANAMRSSLPEGVRDASDRSHQMLNALEAKLERHGLSGQTREFEPLPGKQMQSIRAALGANPGLKNEAATMLGDNGYRQWAQAERTLGEMGLPPNTRAIDPSDPRLHAGVKAALSGDDRKMLEAAQKMGPDKAAAFLEAEGLLAELGLPKHTRGKGVTDAALREAIKARLQSDTGKMRSTLEALGPESAQAATMARGTDATEVLRAGRHTREQNQLSGLAWSNPYPAMVRGGIQTAKNGPSLMKNIDPGKVRPSLLTGSIEMDRRRREGQTP